MKHFLIGEDDVSYHVHDGNRNFLVAKKGISKKMQETIGKLPKYAQGGIVEGDQSTSDQREKTFQEQLNEFVNASNSAAGDIAKAGTDIVSASNAAASDASKIAQEDLASRNPNGSLMGREVAAVNPSVPGESLSSSASVLAAGDLPTGPASLSSPAAPSVPQAPNFLGQFQAGQAKQMQGIQEAANIQSNLAAEQAKILEQAANPELEEKLKNRLGELEQRRQKIDAEIEQFRTAGAEEKIDPNRVWNNMSTGNKILATIGLILGGAGSGGNAANNAALNVLNNAIDRDIKAQQANIDKKVNLYKINLDRFKDVTAAEEMTRIQLNSITQGKIAALAAKSNSELAKANAKIMIGQLQNQNIELGQKLYAGQRDAAIRQTLMSGGQGGKFPVEQAINYLVPEGDRKAAREELQTVNGYKQAVKGVSQLFNEVKDVGVGGKIPFTESKAQLEKVRANIESVIRNSMKGQGALSDRDMENVVKLMPSATDTDAQRKQKMQGVFNILQTKVQGGTPTLTGYRIPVDLNVSTLPPEQERLANWAKQNPKDPRSKEIMKRLGI